MTSPVFVTFTSALLTSPGAGFASGASIRISTQTPIASLSPVTPGYAGTDGSLSNVTLVKYAGGGQDYVSGSVTTVATSLGIAAPSGPIILANTPLGNTAYGSLGTDAVSVSGTQYFVEGFNPTDRTVTNLAALNGTTAGTDKVIYFICDSSGAVLATTSLAGTTCTGTDAFQALALVTGAATAVPITLPAGRFWSGFQVNGNTTKHRTIAASTFTNCTGSLAGVLGTIAAITPTSTVTAGVGPFMQLT